MTEYKEILADRLEELLIYEKIVKNSWQFNSLDDDPNDPNTVKKVTRRYSEYRDGWEVRIDYLATKCLFFPSDFTKATGPTIEEAIKNYFAPRNWNLPKEIEHLGRKKLTADS